MNLQIDEELQSLIPLLSPDELKALEESVLREGIRDAIVVWNGVIIDGHNRYSLSQKHDLDFETVERDFESKDDVKAWMINNQFSRRNLSAYQRSLLALRLEEMYRAKAKKNQIASGENFGRGVDKKVPQNSAEPIVPVETREELAKVASVSRDTISRVKRIEEAATPEQKATLATGQASINEVYNDIKKKERKEAIIEKEVEHKHVLETVTDFDVDIFTTDKKFQIIYADPAWQYWEGGDKNQSLHYSTMGIDDIKALPIERIADENSILFLWVTFPILPDALEVIKSWGFTYSTCGFNWVKKNKISDSWFFGNGAWTRANSELCLIAKRGAISRKNADISQILDDRIMGHSQKPPRVRGLITDLVGELSRIELFSRNTDDDGWFNWGNKI